MNIDFKLIKEKYPKGYKRLLDSEIVMENYKGELQKSKYNKIGHIELLCYCDLEAFFDNNGLFINIFMTHAVVNEKDEIITPRHISYTITQEDIGWDVKSYWGHELKKRSDAKDQAILEAFEILEERLK